MQQIRPLKNGSGIRLCFTHQGQRFNLGLKALKWHSAADQATAAAIAARIMADVISGCFDASLDRYKLESSVSAKGTLTLLGAWDLWASYAGHATSTQHTHNKYIREALADQSTLDPALSPTIYNRRLKAVQCAIAHASGLGYKVEANSYEAMRPRKQTQRSIKPFSRADLLKLI